MKSSLQSLKRLEVMVRNSTITSRLANHWVWYAFQSMNERHLRDLIADAVRMNWSAANSYFDRRLKIVRFLLAAGQACGELPDGDPIILGRCILTAMDGHLDLALTSRCTAPLSIDVMSDFCVRAVRGALRVDAPHATSGPSSRSCLQ